MKTSEEYVVAFEDRKSGMKVVLTYKTLAETKKAVLKIGKFNCSVTTAEGEDVVTLYW
jgi:hypothetical protein